MKIALNKALMYIPVTGFFFGLSHLILKIFLE